MLTGSQRRQRREGIYWFNTNIVKSAAKSSDVKVDSFMSERKTKTNSDIRLCTGCKRFISGRNFWRHQCCDDKPVRVKPLVRLWTMRFGSKHSYFKRCIRYSPNFKNVCLTLAEKHLQLQAYKCAFMRH